MILEEWFCDRELYHKVGFLITVGTEIKELIKEKKGETKNKFKEYLDKEISEKIKCDDIAKLEFEDDKKLLNKILLLHNIQTILNNENVSYRFPFENLKIKKNGWSIEHIHAQNSKKITDIDRFEVWLKNIDQRTFSKETIEKLETFEKNKNIEDIPQLLEIIADNFGDPNIHSIENLALLSKVDNSALNNEMFPEKRKIIIKKEKKGSFIPICTKNIFQKYFNGCSNQIIKWEEKDREAYLKDIKSTLECYLTLKQK